MVMISLVALGREEERPWERVWVMITNIPFTTLAKRITFGICQTSHSDNDMKEYIYIFLEGKY